jgi:hypothetical protein
MTNPRVDAIDQLRDALVTLSNALASGRADDVLAVERSVASAAGSISTGALKLTSAERARLRDSILEARLALMRCRRLGQAATELASCLAVQPSYGRSGALVSAAAPSAFDSRT